MILPARVVGVVPSEGVVVTLRLDHEASIVEGGAGRGRQRRGPVSILPRRRIGSDVFWSRVGRCVRRVEEDVADLGEALAHPAVDLVRMVLEVASAGAVVEVDPGRDQDLVRRQAAS